MELMFGDRVETQCRAPHSSAEFRATPTLPFPRIPEPREQRSRFLARSSGRCFSLGPPRSSSEPIRTGLRVAWLPPGPPTVGTQLTLRDPSLDMWDFSSLISLWINRFYIYLGFAFGFSLWICFQIVIKKQNKNSQEKTVPKASRDLMTNGYISLQKKEVFVSGVKIFYGSQTGTAKGFATVLAEAVSFLDLPVAVINLKEYDPDDHLVEEVTSKNVSAFLVATYTDGRPTESAEWFCRWLGEAANDFRFGKTYLKGVRYAVFGLGNSAYVSHFNTVGTR
ncbi:PREDICTED: S-adenosyl-L-methionine-dependent tRNA 4-demethylwyosine synthase [Lipotes vexillifer]|uniref:S-adenosyl-L-methionine-dependent tRNA 4-demethylwyosine synthase n=1 Tax=Lipotes vexillifer TaxID=118797 RepID=A0A340X0Q0_LIPVE|nr:PREDICTED: S-adenosyl-L-methionine-dependent tRNA 4-demethylwyosine synthase [Lipotes vexillifer]